MAKVSGRAGKLAVSTDGNTYTDIGEISSIRQNDAHEDEDGTTFTSAGSKEVDYGETQASLTVTFMYDEADSGQDIVRTSHQSKTKLYYRYRPAGDTAGNEQQIFQGKIDSLEKGNERNAKVPCTLQVKSHGAITYSQVPA